MAVATKPAGDFASRQKMASDFALSQLANQVGKTILTPTFTLNESGTVYTVTANATTQTSLMKTGGF